MSDRDSKDNLGLCAARLMDAADDIANEADLADGDRLYFAMGILCAAFTAYGLQNGIPLIKMLNGVSDMYDKITDRVIQEAASCKVDREDT